MVFMKLQQNLVSVVQLAAKSGPVDLGEEAPDSTWAPRSTFTDAGQIGGGGNLC